MRLTNHHGVVCHTFVTCLSFCFNTHAPTPPDVRERERETEKKMNMRDKKRSMAFKKRGRTALPVSDGKTI